MRIIGILIVCFGGLLMGVLADAGFAWIKKPSFVKTVYLANLGEWRKDFSSGLKQHDPDWKPSGVTLLADQSSGEALRVSSSINLVSKDFLAIDVTNSYRMTVRVRVSSRNKARLSTRLYAGFGSYDSNKQPLFTCCLKYPASPGAVAVSDDWVELSGIVHGVGDDNSTFRKGAKYIRPALLINYETPDTVTDIGLVRIDLIDDFWR